MPLILRRPAFRFAAVLLPAALAFAKVAAVQAATPTGWLLPWGSGEGQVARSAPEGHHGEQSRRPPQAFAFDQTGALIVSDTFNKRILRVPPASADAAPAPLATAGALEFPADIAVHPDGRVLVADRVRYQLIELGSAPRSYGQRGTGPVDLLDLTRVAWGPNRITAVGDELAHRIMLFDDGRPTRFVPYDEYGFAFDPRGRLTQPRFATLTGFILCRDDESGRRLPALPFDVATPLAIELLEVGEDGTALLFAPTNGSTDGRRDLLRMEPGGRTHVLWTGASLDAARTVVRGPENRLYRASEEPTGYAVRRLESPPPPGTAPHDGSGATAPTTSATAAPAVTDSAPVSDSTTAPLLPLRDVLRCPTKDIGQPVGLVSSGDNIWLIGATGQWARGGASGPGGGRFAPESAAPTLSTTLGPAWPAEGGLIGSALTAPDGGIWLLDARHPVIHAFDTKAAPTRRIALAAWDHAPDLVTAASAGQVLAHDRAASRWLRHDATGKNLQPFTDVAAGAIDSRSELICVQDTDEPFAKVVMQYDCNGNFFKALTTFKESTRPTGARFIGNASTDLLIGYWLGARAIIRRIAPDGSPRGICAFELPPGARTALWSWTISPKGDVLIVTREANDYVVRAVTPP